MSVEPEMSTDTSSQDIADPVIEGIDDASVSPPRRRGRPRKQLRNPNLNTHRHQKEPQPNEEVTTEEEASLGLRRSARVRTETKFYTPAQDNKFPCQAFMLQA